MEGGSIVEAFQAYRDELDAINEKRERVVKASRDVTIHSKKLISQVHRLQLSSIAKELARAKRDLDAIRDTHLSRVAVELQGDDYWRFHSSYSPGIQEFVEAATFLDYRAHGALLSVGDLNGYLGSVRDASDQPFALDVGDYLLGLADLSGELMRLAVTSAALGDRTAAPRIGDFVRALFAGFHALPSNALPRQGLKKKVEVMQQSLQKIETATYTLHVRSSEFPHAAMAPPPPLPMLVAPGSPRGMAAPPSPEGAAWDA